MAGPASLFTCRYWALGSGCPNIANGKSSCPFAHWDTGTLASPYDQRGTCRWWLQGNCGHGSACYFEHRNTGVMGMYQDRLILHGLNLEVANAAAKAGFDTFNHAALYDLIWAVKRIALRASRGAIIDRPRPPRDTVYPDRFRPSGVGDNTKRKRSAPQNVSPPITPIKLESVIKPQATSRNFRYKNKKAPTRPEQAPAAKPSGIVPQGTRKDAVQVSSDDDDHKGATAKRQKLSAAPHFTSRPPADTSQARVVPEDAQGVPANTELLLLQSESVTQDTILIDGHAYVRARHSDVHPDDLGLDKRQLQLLQANLREVKDVLQAAATKMKGCNDSMSSIFERYRHILSRPEIHSLLSPLGENFEMARASSVKGIGYLNEILELLTEK